jgi:hypothetical protein
VQTPMDQTLTLINSMSLVLTLILPLMILLVIMVLFLIDKVRKIEDIANSLISNISNIGGTTINSKVDPSFLGVSGKNLWDTIAEKNNPQNLSENDIDLLRSKFRPMLEKHLLDLFSTGLSDARNGTPKSIPKTEKSYTTLRGEIEIWIPSQAHNTVYNTGFELTKATDADVSRLESKLMETVYELFNSIKLTPPDSLIDELMTKAGYGDDSEVKNLLEP